MPAQYMATTSATRYATCHRLGSKYPSASSCARRASKSAESASRAKPSATGREGRARSILSAFFDRMWKLLYASVASLPSDSLMIEPPGWRFIKSLTSYTRPRMIISLLVSIEETVRSAASVRDLLVAPWYLGSRTDECAEAASFAARDIPFEALRRTAPTASSERNSRRFAQRA